MIPHFEGSSKVALTIFIDACKEAKEMVLNAEGNLVKLLRSKITGEARRCIIGNYYNNLQDFISKLKTIFAPSKTVYQLQGDLSRIYMWENESVLSYATRIQEIAAEILECHRQNNNGKARNELRRGNRQHPLFQEVEKSSHNNREFEKTNKINLGREDPIKCQKIGYTAETCFQFVQHLTNKNSQNNQSRNGLRKQNNQYLGNNHNNCNNNNFKKKNLIRRKTPMPFLERVHKGELKWANICT